MNNTIAQLQRWYARQCDGEWEHGFGIRIETLDNPGWLVKINLAGTALEGQPFAPLEHGLHVEESTDWYRVWVEDGKFQGAGDSTKLAFMLECFLAWADRPGE